MHIVVFKSAEGKPGYYQTESLDDALRFVERVRNFEGVDEAKLYRMTEVPLSVKTVVKVELASEAPGFSRLEFDEADSSASALSPNL
jgi:hypothetical protein